MRERKKELIEYLDAEDEKEINDYENFNRMHLEQHSNEVELDLLIGGAANESLVERFESQVKKHLNRTALKYGDKEFTYRTLNSGSNRIAYRILNGSNEKTGKNIALLFEHGPTMIEGMLGVLKAGCTYIPLDTSCSEDRLVYILKDSNSEVIVTNNANIGFAAKLIGESGEKISLINIEDKADIGVVYGNPGIKVEPHSIAYIIYVFGSPVRPKRVVQSHRNVMNSIRRYINGLHITCSDRIALFTSFSQAIALTAIFSALLSGAALYPYDIKIDGINEELSKWLKKEGITVKSRLETLFLGGYELWE